MTYDGLTRDQLIDALEARDLRIECLEFEISEIRGEVLTQPDGIRLAPKEFIVINTLAQRSPRAVTKQGLLTAIYNGSVDQPGIKIIDVWVCRLRKAIKPLGLSIETIWGEGYRMPHQDALRWLDMCGRKPKTIQMDNFTPVGEAATRVLEGVAKLLGEKNGRPST